MVYILSLTESNNICFIVIYLNNVHLEEGFRKSPIWPVGFLGFIGFGFYWVLCFFYLRSSARTICEKKTYLENLVDLAHQISFYLASLMVQNILKFAKSLLLDL